VLVAVLCAFALAGDKAKGKGAAVHGALSEAPAGGDAKVVAVLTTKDKETKQAKTINVIAANDALATQLKDLAKKGAKVKIKGEVSADGASITASEVDEAPAKGADGGDKPKKKKDQ
jgi:hypothetical protein